MSAFLGPIHFWLYNKICFQEKLTARIADETERAGRAELKDNGLKEQCVAEDIPPLEDVIDTGNIHSWLQGRINDAESRYARLVTGLIQNHSDRKEAILNIAYDFGKENAVDTDSSPADAYKKFDDTFLNGMPCDRVNCVTEQEDHKLSWEQAEDLHAPFWENIGGNADLYYEIRTQVMNGMLDGSGITLNQTAPNKWELNK